MFSKQPQIILFLFIIILAGAVLRIWGIGFGLPATLARPEENIIQELAVDASCGDLNPKFFTYPTGFVYLLAALFHITIPLCSPPHPVDPSWNLQTLYALWPQPFYLTGRWTVAIMGILSIFLVYLIGKRVGGRTLGLVAAWFFAVAPIPVRHAHFSVSDFPMTFFCLLSVLFVLRRIQSGGLKDSLLAGLFGGLAASMKYPGALMAIPILLAHLQLPSPLLLQGGKEGGSDKSSPLRSRGEKKGGSFIHHHLWYSALVMIGTFIALNPFIFVEWQLFRAHFAFESAHLMAPHFGIDLGPGLLYHTRVTFPTAIGMPVYLAAIAGLLWWIIRRRKEQWIVIITMVVFFLVLGRGRAVFFRYLDSTFPFLTILAAGFLVDISERLPWKQTSRTILLSLLALGLSVPGLTRTIKIDHLLSQKDTRVQAAEWLNTHLKPGTTVFLSGFYGTPPIVPHFLKYLGITGYRETRFFDKFDSAIAKVPEWNCYPLKVVIPDDIFPDLPIINLSENLWRDSLQTWDIDWVVMDRYFLTYYSEPPLGLYDAVRKDFNLVVSFSPLDPQGKSQPFFEQQDAFYLPVAAFQEIVRPGPEIRIYQRKTITK